MLFVVCFGVPLLLLCRICLVLTKTWPDSSHISLYQKKMQKSKFTYEAEFILVGELCHVSEISEKLQLLSFYIHHVHGNKM